MNIAPLFLRILLAVVFLWAGLGKVLTTFPAQGQDALTLYNLGVIAGPAPRAAPPSSPASPLPMPSLSPGTQNPETQPPPVLTPGDHPAPAGPISRARPPAAASLVRYQPSARLPRLAADFDTPVEVASLHHITLMLAAAAAPGIAADGSTVSPILPAWMGSNPWARILAWTAAITELLGGAFVLLGLCARFWALLLCGVMGMAIWLTEIGPAIQKGGALLGFLPAGRQTFDPSWIGLLFPFAILCVCLSLLFSGPGSLSLDRALFRGRRDEDD